MIMKRKAARSTPAAKTKLPVVLHQSSRPATSMQGVARGSLAERFHQNWLARHSGDPLVTSGPVDDSLTSLSWLQNLNIMKMAAPTPPSSPSPALDSRSYSKPPAPCPVSVPPIQPPKVEPRLSFAEPNPTAVCGLGVGMDNVNYKTNPYVKPPFSYATLICMAMKETKKNKITLSAIYNWITENFMYYRMADPSWQNSIRHNLSLNKCFEKVPRRKDEPGKGGFWRINPEYTNLIENGIFKRRRGSRDSCPAPAPKRIKKEDETIAAVNSIRPNMSRGEDKLLSNGSVVHFGASYDDDDSHALKGDFNWTSILNQDIEINGHPIKTEELLDSSSEDTSPLISSLSPPSSETNSEDLGLDDLFTPVGLSSDVALDFTTHEALDLTVTGHHIPTPGWWSDNPLNLAEEFQALQDITNDQSSGLNTPVPPSPSSLTDDALWSDSHFNTSDDVAHAFDVDNLFDIDNIPSPHIS